MKACLLPMPASSPRRMPPCPSLPTTTLDPCPWHAQVSFMPILVLAARLCPPGVEATVYATLMSCLNGGAFLGGALGAGLTAALGVTSDNFDHLFTLVALCTLSTLAPWPFLRLLPDDLSEGVAAATASEGGSSSSGGGGDVEAAAAAERKEG